MIARAVLLVVLCALPVFSEFLTDSPAVPATEEGIWIDLYSGDEISFDAVIADLLTADVLYFGESHDSDIHHKLHEAIIGRLCDAGLCPVLIMEQIEREKQADLDAYNAGQISFEDFSQKSSWAESWSNWADYKSIMEKVRVCGGMLIAANAPASVISKVSRLGISSLESAERKRLPASIELNFPVQEKLLDKILWVHAFMAPERKRFMFEAQACRDETMAETAAGLLGNGRSDGKKRIIIVLTGSMHVRNGLGIPDRLRKRAGTMRDRILLVSGAPFQPQAETPMARNIAVSHDDLKAGERPAGDYVYIIKNAE